MSGRFIVAEGLDGSGKTTFVGELCKALATRGTDFEQQAYPSQGPIGKVLRAGLDGEVRLAKNSYLHLFAADGVDREPVVRKLLDQGKTIVSDRHPFSSSFAYQTAIHPIEIVAGVTNPRYFFTVPDLTFVLDVPSEVALERLGKREKGLDSVYEDATLLEYDFRRARYTLLTAVWPNCMVLDGTRSITTNVEAALKILDYLDAKTN